MKQRLIAILLASIFTIVLVGCSSSQSAKTQEGNTDIQPPEQQLKEDVENELVTQEDEEQDVVGVGNETVAEGKVAKDKVTTEEVAAPVKAEQPIEDSQDMVSEASKQQKDSSEQQQSVEEKVELVTKTPPPTNKSEVQNQATNQVLETEKTNVATITIKADLESGVILAPTKVEVEAGDTVLDLLKKVTRAERIQMEYKGSAATAYIEGINNLYEFDKGPKSGWMYNVNGTFKRSGAGLVEVKSGDQIEWVYTLDLGKDVGAN